MTLQNKTRNSYLFCCKLFILVRVFRNDYSVLLNISASVLVTHIDQGYDHHLKVNCFCRLVLVALTTS